MSDAASVPRGTPEYRVGARIPEDTKRGVRAVVVALNARGLQVTEADLVHMLVDETLTVDHDLLERRLRAWRAGRSS